MATAIENSSAATKNAIRDIALGAKILTVGAGGRFATVAEAVAFINTQTRYNTVYNTGTCAMVSGSKSIIPAGGADWSALSEAANGKQLYLRIAVSQTIFMPVQGITPNINNTPTWGNYGELKYVYEGASGNKTYSFVEPIWYHIQLLAGTVKDPVAISWPLFTTMSGISKEASVWQGSIGADIAEVGFFGRDFTWGSIHLVWSAGEEALITSNGSLTLEQGYAEIVLQNIGGGQGNCNRDVLYRKTGIASYALFQSDGCDYYAHYDTIQCTARHVVFRDNNVHISTQDTTVMSPTGFRWFSSVTAPETDLFLDISNNNFHVICSAGARSSIGLVLLDDSAVYMTAPPNLYGRVVNNHIEVKQLGTGDATGINSAPFLMGTNNGSLFIDANTFDVVSVGGVRGDVITHSTASQFTLGQNNITLDGSALVVSGNPKRIENHGISAAIASGATIAHGLGVTPTSFHATPTSAKTDVFVTADATNLTITYGGGGTSTFAWGAKK